MDVTGTNTTHKPSNMDAYGHATVTVLYPIDLESEKTYNEDSIFFKRSF